MKPSNVNLKKVSFSDLKKLGEHANIVYVNYDSNQFFIKTPELTLPFDSGTMFPDQRNDKNGKYSVRVSLDNYDQEGHVNHALYNLLRDLDEKILKEGQKNSMPWFKKKSLSDELSREIYNPMVRFSIDKETGEESDKFPPTFAFKILQKEDKILCKCYNGNSDVKNDELNVNDREEENYVTLETLLKKKSKVKMLLRCNGIWFAGGKFGCTWRAEQIMITPTAGFDDCAFLEDSDEEDVSENVTKLDHFIDSEDDEDDGKPEVTTQEETKEDSDESDEEPEPVKPKKKVRKAKKSA
jgi:hypothetical protein